ncbi:MAG: indole-3-glycerol phosphate synthase TrpC [Limnochordia bacterium]|jgi:indole-3-glycerol phosphate synthase
MAKPILEAILAHKRREVEELTMPGRLPRKRRSFREAIAAPGIQIIAEIKRASPSRGIICPDFNPEAIAKAYVEGGAAAISILTDQHFFGGSITHLQAVGQRVPLPLLRKDFIIHRNQIEESYLAGADAILLIVAALTDGQLRDFLNEAHDYGLDVLVEIADGGQLERALKCGAQIIGVNNRDLQTFEVGLEKSLELLGQIPENCLKVSESGIHTRADVELLEAAGADGLLIGTSLVSHPRPAGKLKELLGR